MEGRFATHGRILAGTVNTPAFEASLDDYRRLLALEVVDEGIVPESVARAWGAPAMAGRRQALLRGPGGRPGLLRLVHGSAVEGYRPLRTHGWAAYELSVKDAFALHEAIAAERAAFRVLGAPRHVPGFDNFIPFQVAGRAGEVLYLNTVLRSEMAGLDLPHAQAVVDSMFIAVLAAADRAATVAFHVDRLGFEEGDTYVIPYSMINESFGLAADHQTAMTMTKVGRMPAAEIDQYPEPATARPRADGELPPGNAMLTLGVRSLDAVRAPFHQPPAALEGALHGGRRAATLVGPSGEWIELVEVGA